MTSAQVIADSLNFSRLTSFLITFPRFLQAELNTHKMLAKNSASSRAIPVSKQVEMVRESGFVPKFWGSGCSGMQANEPLPEIHAASCMRYWNGSLLAACRVASDLSARGLHKQWTNRMLEPFMYQKVIITGDADSWANFFNLRCSEHSQPEFDELAGLMLKAYINSVPRKLGSNEWHAPNPTQNSDTYEQGFEPLCIGELKLPRYAIRSLAACARISYRKDDDRSIELDLELANRLAADGHMSPFEHVCQPFKGAAKKEAWDSGMWSGWLQLRKCMPNENQTNLNPQELLLSWEKRQIDRGSFHGAAKH